MTAEHAAALRRMLDGPPGGPEDGKHLSAEELAGFASDFLDPDEASRAERHLDACSSCLSQMEALLDQGALWDGQAGRLECLRTLTAAQIAGEGATLRLALDRTQPQWLRAKAARSLPILALAGWRRTLIAVQHPEWRRDGHMVGPFGTFRSSSTLAGFRQSMAFGPMMAAAGAAAVVLVFMITSPNLNGRTSPKSPQIARLPQPKPLETGISDTHIGERSPAPTEVQKKLSAVQRENQRLAETDRRLSQQSAVLQGQVQTLHDRIARLPLPVSPVGTHSLPKPPQVASRTALDVPLSSLAPLFSKGGELMGGDDDTGFVQITPIGTFVLSQTPTFVWHAYTKAADNTADGAQVAYKVSVYDANDGTVAQSDALTQATSWTPASPLPRGRILHWQVAVVKDGETIAYAPAPDAPRARFELLGEEQAKKIQEDERKFRDKPLELAVRYAQAGLLDDAQKKMQALKPIYLRSKVEPEAK